MTMTYVTQISGLFYAFAGDNITNQVYSIGADKPPKSTGCHTYFAPWCDSGIRYVASPSASKKSAIAKAKRHGNYFGVI